jgi:hypothetical protein
MISFGVNTKVETLKHSGCVLSNDLSPRNRLLCRDGRLGGLYWSEWDLLFANESPDNGNVAVLPEHKNRVATVDFSCKGLHVSQLPVLSKAYGQWWR